MKLLRNVAGAGLVALLSCKSLPLPEERQNINETRIYDSKVDVIKLIKYVNNYGRNINPPQEWEGSEGSKKNSWWKYYRVDEHVELFMSFYILVKEVDGVVMHQRAGSWNE